MCGIAGVIFHRGPDAPRRYRPAPAFTSVMQDRLAHRGPDGAGVVVDDGVALVHTRLAIVDPAHGQQPLRSPDGRHTLVVNGEIYGHRRLRQQLVERGAPLRTHSDAEVLLWSLVLDGPTALSKLEGEYAFCWWDAHRRVAVLGRDPLGVKPLVWTEHDGAWWFASELQVLTGVLPTRPDLDVVVDTFLCPPLSGSDALPAVGVRNVPAGTIITLAEGAPPHHHRHSHHHIGQHRGSPAPAALREALTAAVVDRLDADVDVGVFLSGGVDSTAITAAALTGPRAVSGPLSCFTIRFDDHDRGGLAVAAGSIVVGDDAPFVESLAERWPIALTRVRASRVALVDALEDLWGAQDRIAAWEQELTQRFLARAAAQSVKAVLVGDAADETHFGYAFALADDVAAHPSHFLARFGVGLRASLLRPQWRHRVDAVVQDAVDVADDDGLSFDRDARERRLAMATVVLRRWLPRLLHNGDLHTMAYGLEARVPFADRRVLDVAARTAIDDAWGNDCDVGGPEKRFLRQAVGPWVPASVTARRKSALPRDDGLGPLLQQRLAHRLATPGTRDRLAPLFDVDAVVALADAERTATIDDTTRAVLFSVLAVEGFLRRHGPS